MANPKDAPLGPIVFHLTPKQLKALGDLAGGCRVILSGRMREGKLVIDTFTLGEPLPDSAFVAVNAPFKTGIEAQ
jgi:hypothetical protein